MPYDEFDVYKTAIEDTNEINRRRLALDNLYVGIITLILTGDAYVAITSQFNSWLPIIVTTAAGAVGIAIVLRWRQGFGELNKILEKRYEFLRTLEKSASLSAIGASSFTQEWDALYAKKEAKRFRRFTLQLQFIFGLVFVAIPVFLTLVTLARVVPELQPLYYFIQPLPTLPAPTPTAIP
jgi:hypothetical protein